MLIKSLGLTNFGVYAGRHELDLRPEGADKPVILLGGLNGGGKTTILEALQLVLYGKRAGTPRRKGKSYPDYLLSLINRSIAPQIGAAVEIVFEDTNSSSEYNVQRKWKNEAGKVREHLTVSVNGQPAPDIAETWDDEVDNFLPQRLCSLFLFDGEQIENLADPEQTQAILDTALSGLLGIDLIDQAIGDLSILQRKMLRMRPHDVDDAIIAAQTELRDAEICHKKAQYIFDGINAHKFEVADQLAKIEDTLERQGGGAFDALISLESELSSVEAEKAQLESELRVLAAGALPLALLGGELREVLAVADKEELASVNRIKADALLSVSADLINFLSQHGVSKTTIREAGAWLDDRRKSLDTEATGSSLDTGFGLANRLRGIIASQLPADVERAKEIGGLIDKQTKRIRQIARKIQSAPDRDSIEDLLMKRDELRKQATTLAHQLEDAHRTVSQLEARHKTADERLRKVARSKIELEADKRAIDVAEELAVRLSRVKREAVKNHLAQLESLVAESYRQLLHKGALVSEVSIDPESLHLMFTDSTGRVVPAARLSAGERQLLATAILWALGKASGKKLPVVIDTPLGRLDSSHRSNLVANYFPNVSSQVVLLSTDEEISGQHLDILQPHISKTYLIDFDDETQSSVIRPGYFQSRAA